MDSYNDYKMAQSQRELDSKIQPSNNIALAMNRDITFCSSTDCPSKECRIKVLNNKFEPHEIISMADFSGVCRFYIGWVLENIESEGE